jgi:hypothetical protein
MIVKKELAMDLIESVEAAHPGIHRGYTGWLANLGYTGSN